MKQDQRLSSGGLTDLDKVLRFSFQSRTRPSDYHEDDQKAVRRDITAAIDMVCQAAEAIKAAEDRARDMEARAEALAEQAARELRDGEARLQAAEARARAAEARAQEAEDWLQRLQHAIVERLAPDARHRLVAPD